MSLFIKMLKLFVINLYNNLTKSEKLMGYVKERQ